MKDQQCRVCGQEAIEYGTFYYVNKISIPLCKCHSIELFKVGEMKFNAKYKICNEEVRNIYQDKNYEKGGRWE